mmetsp:Transcript_52399/g.125167  ORF Transcript_52399/g.125167 Transcript_52399/m.125167 type:complete len:206 (-) Transcript_52399:237-854(-)
MGVSLSSRAAARLHWLWRHELIEWLAARTAGKSWTRLGKLAWPRTRRQLEERRIHQCHGVPSCADLPGPASAPNVLRSRCHASPGSSGGCGISSRNHSHCSLAARMGLQGQHASCRYSLAAAAHEPSGFAASCFLWTAVARRNGCTAPGLGGSLLRCQLLAGLGFGRSDLHPLPLRAPRDLAWPSWSVAPGSANVGLLGRGFACC